MADILPFRKPKLVDKYRGKSLCREGFHKWEVDNEHVFDSKLGRLVTIYRCKRCKATKNKAV